MTVVPPARGIPLDAKLAFLRRPRSYPDPAIRVEAVETHMSWVFLAGRYAYKLKKPVRHDALDFRTLDARHFYCKEEIRLNRRLAPTVYLGVVALTIDDAGHLRLGGNGAVADWLVKMRRLPARHMLDHAIKAGSASEADLERVAARLAVFYGKQPPVAVDPAAYLARFATQIEAAFAGLRLPAYRLPIERIDAICAAQRALLRRLSGPLGERARAGRIIEGHGDLRPEHVCLRPVLAIIDCLEFSYDLRVLDAIDEVAFLALECERLGTAALGAVLLRRYHEVSGDAASPAVIGFYQSFRACMRARIAIQHLDEERFRDCAEWRRRAMAYLRLAERRAQYR